MYNNLLSGTEYDMGILKPFYIPLNHKHNIMVYINR